MRGERNLTTVSTKQFVSLLGLGGEEALYFETLVLFNQAKGWDLKGRHIRRIVEMRLALDSSDLRLLKAREHLNLYSTWYVIPILVLTEHSDFKTEPSWISSKLGAKVSEVEIRSALDLLLVAGLLEHRKNGFVRTVSRTEMDVSILEHMSQNAPPPGYFAEMSERAAAAHRLPRSEVVGAAGTVMATKEDLNFVRLRLNEAITEINALLNRRTGEKELYQISAAFFPLAAVPTRAIRKKSR